MTGKVWPQILFLNWILITNFGYFSIAKNFEEYEIGQKLLLLDDGGNNYYFVNWNLNRVTQTIIFEVIVKTTGFIGFGLSTQGSMEGADIVIGGVKMDGNLYFNDYHSTGNGMPSLDDHEDWTLLGGSENGTHTLLKFERFWDTCDDDNDVQITMDTLYIIWSFGRTDNIFYHGKDHRGTEPVNLLDAPEPKFDRSGYSLQIWQLRVDDTIPSSVETIYLCTIHKLDKRHAKKEMIALEPYFENEAGRQHVHHFQAFACKLDDPKIFRTIQNLVGSKGQDCFGKVYEILVAKFCTRLIYGWSVGAKRIITPAHVGVPVSFDAIAEDQFFLFQVHYNNPGGLAKAKKIGTGFNAYFAKEGRKFQGSVMTVGLQVVPSLFVPPAMQEFTLAGHCSSKFTKQFFPPSGIKIVSVHMHAHLAGIKLRVRHFRNGQELPWILNDDNWHFNFQLTRQLPTEVTVLPNDHLTMECVMSTRRRVTVTLGGDGGMDEMCHVFLFYYPRLDLVTCKSFYPLKNFFRKFGVHEWDPTTFPDPDIKSPRRWAGKKFSDIANAHNYTHHFVQDLQKDLRFGRHLAVGESWRNLVGKTNLTTTTNYPKHLNEYKVSRPDSCIKNGYIF